jgi:hypothetical protein
VHVNEDVNATDVNDHVTTTSTLDANVAARANRGV